MAQKRQGSKPQRTRVEPTKARYSTGDVARVIKADPPTWRSEFRRDYARLLHSASFRRLQGKTQLFPGSENDFFRNRLTHSLEVAQIGKTIATILNAQFYDDKPDLAIDVDLVEFACLAHDLGHPPFGHIGEHALDACMKEYGGFEGNAQTFRILARLEKKELEAAEGAKRNVPIFRGRDLRAGLNLTYRALASVLKYDKPIPPVRNKQDGLAKGYYYFDEEFIDRMRTQILGGEAESNTPLRTIECSIMDTADDIAYSTYDLEDTFKSNLLTPLGFWLLSRDDYLMRSIAKKISGRIKEFYPSESSDFNAKDVIAVMYNFFKIWFNIDTAEASSQISDAGSLWAYLAVELGRASREVATDGYYRTRFTSGLIANALDNIQLVENSTHPALDRVQLRIDKFKEVEVLKGLNFATVINSSLMKTIEHQGQKIVQQLFDVLGSPDGSRLLPDDHKGLYDYFPEPTMKKRVVCDFIAGMTDRYALEFYERLTSTKPGSIYRPHN